MRWKLTNLKWKLSVTDSIFSKLAKLPIILVLGLYFFVLGMYDLLAWASYQILIMLAVNLNKMLLAGHRDSFES